MRYSQLNFQAFDIRLKAYRVIFSRKENALNLNDSFPTKSVNTCDGRLCWKQRSRGRYFSFSKHFTESSLDRFLAYPRLSIYLARFLVSGSLKTTGTVMSTKMILPTLFTIILLFYTISYSRV